MTSHVYRDVCINGEEAARLREIEKFFVGLNEQLGGGSRFGPWADDLHVIARRYERGVDADLLRSGVLTLSPRTARGPLVLIEGGRTA